MILVSQDNIRKRHRDMTGGQEFFFDGGESHRCAGVDENISEEIDLLVEQFDVELVGAGIDSLVDIAQIIA